MVLASMLNVDLHCHSHFSDGVFAPAELAVRAQAQGVDVWALTDHDEIGGQLRAATAAKTHGMRYLTGVEISVTFLHQTVHIVGLGFDAANQARQIARLVDGLAVEKKRRAVLTIERPRHVVPAAVDEIGGEYRGVEVGPPPVMPEGIAAVGKAQGIDLPGGAIVPPTDDAPGPKDGGLDPGGLGVGAVAGGKVGDTAG